MDVARLARLGDDAGAHPLALADQVVMDGAHRQQHRNRRVRRVDVAVSEDEDVVASVDRVGSSGADGAQRRLQSGRAIGYREVAGQVGGGEGMARNRTDSLHLLVHHQRAAQTEHAGVLRRLLEEAAPLAEIDIE